MNFYLVFGEFVVVMLDHDSQPLHHPADGPPPLAGEAWRTTDGRPYEGGRWLLRREGTETLPYMGWSETANPSTILRMVPLS